MDENPPEIIRAPQFKTEAAVYHLPSECWGEIVYRIMNELYPLRDIWNCLEPLPHIYKPKMTLLGNARTLYFETEAGVTAIRGIRRYGKENMIALLGELTLNEKDGLVLKINKYDDLNFDPSGILKIATDRRYYI